MVEVYFVALLFSKSKHRTVNKTKKTISIGRGNLENSPIRCKLVFEGVTLHKIKLQKELRLKIVKIF